MKSAILLIFAVSLLWPIIFTTVLLSPVEGQGLSEKPRVYHVTLTYRPDQRSWVLPVGVTSTSNIELFCNGLQHQPGVDYLINGIFIRPLRANMAAGDAVWIHHDRP